MGYSSYVMVGYRTILVGRERYGLVFLPFIRHIDDPFAVSANPTKEIANPHVAAGTNDLPPPMKNERLKPNTTRLKRKRPQPEHR